MCGWPLHYPLSLLAVLIRLLISKDLLVEFDLLNELLDLLHADLAGHFVLVGPFEIRVLLTATPHKVITDSGLWSGVGG